MEFQYIVTSKHSQNIEIQQQLHYNVLVVNVRNMISLAGSGHIIVFEFSLTSIANKTHESLRLMKFQNLTNVSGYQLLNFYFHFR